MKIEFLSASVINVVVSTCGQVVAARKSNIQVAVVATATLALNTVELVGEHVVNPLLHQQIWISSVIQKAAF